MRSFLVLALLVGCSRESTPLATSTPPVAQPAPAAQALAPGAKPAMATAPAGAIAGVESAPAKDTIPEPNRALTAGEIAMLRPIFREGINYDQVRVVDAKYPFQPEGVYMTPRGHVYAPGPLYREDFSKAGPSYRAVFVHELTHVWQHENGMDLVAQGVVEFTKHKGAYEKAYPYTLVLGRDLVEFGMEQQASIVEDYFIVTVDGGRPLRMENRGLAPAERDALFASTLGKFTANARYVRQMSAKDVADRHAKSAEATPPGPAGCEEKPAAHEATHLCGWRYPR